MSEKQLKSDYVMLVLPNCGKCMRSKLTLDEAGMGDKVRYINSADPNSREEAVRLSRTYHLKSAGTDIIDINNDDRFTIESFIASMKEDEIK